MYKKVCLGHKPSFTVKRKIRNTIPKNGKGTEETKQDMKRWKPALDRLLILKQSNCLYKLRHITNFVLRGENNTFRVTQELL